MASPLPSKTSSVDASPAVFKSAPEHRAPNVNPPVKEVAPTEPVKKPALGDVHLAAPVVNRGNAQTVSDAEPAIATSAPDTGADAATSLMRSKSPVAPLPVGGDVKPAQLTKSVPPQYPAIAKSQHIFGNVQIDALVDASGNVAEARAIGGPQLLYRAALDAVKQWKYAPATLNGEPTSMHLTVVVQFRAQ
jgi:protein TonB